MSKISAAVTTSRRSNVVNTVLAQDVAEKLGLPFVERDNLPLAVIAERCSVEFVAVAKDNMLHVVSRNGDDFFFHPNMAKTRLKNLRKNLGDRMASAMNLERGMSVLDCTLVLGSDATVAAYVVGDAGRVVALESNPLIAAVVAHGLQHFICPGEELRAAMRRVNVINANYGEFLRGLPDDSFDVVYFDPMFRAPLKKSSGLNPLRPLSDARALTLVAANEAVRVAKRIVVLKERTGSAEFARLGFVPIDGNGKIGYGVRRK